jgi:hypothetical protein
MEFHSTIELEIKRRRRGCVVCVFIPFWSSKNEEENEKERKGKGRGKEWGKRLGYYFQNQIPPTHLISPCRTLTKYEAPNTFTPNET